jgi:ABC-type polar amino acid transport system ATPase subunit
MMRNKGWLRRAKSPSGDVWRLLAPAGRGRSLFERGREDLPAIERGAILVDAADQERNTVRERN